MMKLSCQTPPYPKIILVVLIIFVLLALSLDAAQTVNREEKGVEFECIGSYGETIKSCAQYSHYAFLNQGYTLRVLDIKDPTHLTEVFWKHFDFEITSLAVKYPVLYIGLKGCSIQIVDISNPARPVPNTMLSDSRNKFKFEYLEVMGNYLLAETIHGKGTDYAVYNISNPFNPSKLLHGDRWHGSGRGENNIFITDGSHIFYANPVSEDNDDTPKVTIVDLTTSPTTVSQSPVDEHMSFSVDSGKLVAVDPTTSTTIPLAKINDADRVWVYRYEDGREIVQEGQQPEGEKYSIRKTKRGDPVEGIQIFEHCPGASPLLRTVYGINSGAEQFKIAGTRGYLMDGNDGLQVLDMSDPAHPRLLSRTTFYNRRLRSDKEPQIPEPVIRAIENDCVFITGKDPGYLILDCSLPTSPTLRTSYTGPTGPMSILGKQAYVAAGKDGLQILDISNPHAILRLGSYSTLEAATDLVTSGTLVYLLANDLLIVDAKNPEKPVLRGKTAIAFDGENSESDEGTYLDKESAQIKRLGSAIYVIEKGLGHLKRSSCRVIDASDPANPRLLPGQVNVEPPEEEDEEAKPKTLTNPSAPSATTGWYLCLPSSLYATHGGWVTIFKAKLTVFDLYDPFNPKPVFHTDAMHTAKRTAFFKNTLYLADGPGGLLIMRPVKKVRQ